ncbi:TetR/AcrR family transcriptional regulator [Phenylobacterium sp.]|uniref:TetR/AcrR family transcriptional regulator n=1 Tax=Phenylobacterium sp. TaxID=1871053 RepID=UPI0025DF13AF|nr:TetR/AcrR family transcriptional regulator [Phenylobacterium sp.]
MARADGQSGGAIRGRRPKGQGPDLRQSILDAGEGLFSRHGFYGVTVRQVAAEAGVDTALIHYYFGAKRELFDSVFARRAEILNTARLDALSAYAEAHRGALQAEGVIEAFIGPLIELSMTNDEGWKNYFRLVALVNNTPAWGGETMHRYFDPVVRALVEMLRQALPDAEVRDLYWSYQFLTGAMMLTLSETGRIDQLSDGLCRSTDLEAVRVRLYAWCAAGLSEVVRRRA